MRLFTRLIRARDAWCPLRPLPMHINLRRPSASGAAAATHNVRRSKWCPDGPVALAGGLFKLGPLQHPNCNRVFFLRRLPQEPNPTKRIFFGCGVSGVAAIL